MTDAPPRLPVTADDPAFDTADAFLRWDDEQCRALIWAQFAGELGARHIPIVVAQIKRVRAGHRHFIDQLQAASIQA